MQQQSEKPPNKVNTLKCYNIHWLKHYVIRMGARRIKEINLTYILVLEVLQVVVVQTSPYQKNMYQTQLANDLLHEC